VGTAVDCTACGQQFNCSPSHCYGCQLSATTCTGTPTPCTAYNGSSANACESDHGCTWDNATTLCVGGPTACSAYPGNCGFQPGCTDGPVSCNGPFTPPCSLLNATTCDTRAGCTYKQPTTCTGNMTPCNQIPVNMCSTQPGCVVTS
jgi:hypothetical protein